MDAELHTFARRLFQADAFFFNMLESLGSRALQRGPAGADGARDEATRLCSTRRARPFVQERLAAANAKVAAKEGAEAGAAEASGGREEVEEHAAERRERLEGRIAFLQHELQQAPAATLQHELQQAPAATLQQEVHWTAAPAPAQAQTQAQTQAQAVPHPEGPRKPVASLVALPLPGDCPAPPAAGLLCPLADAAFACQLQCAAAEPELEGKFR
jgi:hypothetical protein